MDFCLKKVIHARIMQFVVIKNTKRKFDSSIRIITATCSLKENLFDVSYYLI